MITFTEDEFDEFRKLHEKQERLAKTLFWQLFFFGLGIGIVIGFAAKGLIDGTG